MKTLVVARLNNEDVSWMSQVDPSWANIVYDQFHPNGREAFAWLLYLTSYRQRMRNDDEIIFAQGNPFDHDPDFLAHIDDPSVAIFGTIHDCDSNSAPAYTAPLHSWCDVFGLDKPEIFEFVAGAQFRVFGRQVNTHSLQFYKALFNLTFVNPKAAWIIERLWPVIFK